MASVMMNVGKARLAESALANLWDGGTVPSNLYLALITAGTPGEDDTNGSGYTECADGGYSQKTLPRSASGWDSFVIDQVDDQGEAQMVDAVFGPFSGAVTITYAVLCETATLSTSEIVCAWDLGSVNVGAGNSLTLENLQINFT